MTIPIEYVIVRLKDGSVKKISVGNGDGWYRENLYVGELKSFKTFEVMIASGVMEEVQGIRTEE